jgi:hypothetical protein
MLTSVFIYPYKAGSKGSKRLADKVGKLIKLKGSRFRPSPRKTIINWGARWLPEDYNKCNVINHPVQVEGVGDKLKFFRTMGASKLVPEWTTDADVAREWEAMVVCRTMLNASGGAGIVLAGGDTEQAIVNAPLYTRYVKKKDEYRVHIFNNQPIDVQKKAKVRGEEVHYQIRNRANGFIYMRGGIAPPEAVIKAASDVMLFFPRLHFGAVDVIYNTREERAYVLEVNSAPGLEGETVDSYAQVIKEMMR